MRVFTVLFQRENEGLLLVYSLSTVFVFTFHSLLNSAIEVKQTATIRTHPFRFLALKNILSSSSGEIT